MAEESEFGKELVVCLVKFAEHQWRIHGDLETYKSMHEKNPDLFSESHAVHMHMNGASDHLYDIKVPEGIKGSLIGEKVTELQTKGLAMGHNYEKKENWTKEDAFALYDLAIEIALLIDTKLLGLNAEKGQW